MQTADTDTAAFVEPAPLAYSVNAFVKASNGSCGRTKVYELIRDGRLKAKRLDGRTLIPARLPRMRSRPAPGRHEPRTCRRLAAMPAAAPRRTDFIVIDDLQDNYHSIEGGDCFDRFARPRPQPFVGLRTRPIG